jgi:hypothetical protein
MSEASNRYNIDVILNEQRKEREKALGIVALVRAQEREKERNYVMRWVRDPEDHTLWRWLPIKKRKRISKK